MDSTSSPTRLESRLAAIDSPVQLVFFTQTFGCDSCLMARQLVDRIAAASDQLTVVEHNLVLDKDEAAAYGVERAPALAVVGGAGDGDGGDAGDVGFRYYGVPAGFELESIVEAIELVAAGGAEAVAAGKSALSEDTLDAVDALDRHVHLRVFVTPT